MMNKFNTKGVYVFVAALLVILFLASGGGLGNAHVKSPSILNDNDTVLFSHCIKSKCQLATYSIDGQEFQLIDQPEDESWSYGHASNDGQLITFSRQLENEDSHYISVMNRDGSNLMNVTDPNKELPYALMPSFNLNNDEIVFVRAKGRRDSPNQLSGMDVFIVNLGSSIVNQVTSAKFYSIKKPYFYDDSILFSAYGPTNMNSYPLNFPGYAWFKYVDRYGDNAIFQIRTDQVGGLEKPFLMNGDHSVSPSVSHRGDVLFVSRTNKMDQVHGAYNYDLFLQRDGVIKRLTSWKSSFSTGDKSTGGARFVHEAAISPDGSRVVFSQFKTGLRNVLWVMDLESWKIQRVDVPRNLG